MLKIITTFIQEDDISHTLMIKWILFFGIVLFCTQCKKCTECIITQNNQTQDTITSEKKEFCGSKKDVLFYQNAHTNSSGTFYENGDTIVKSATCVNL